MASFHADGGWSWASAVASVTPSGDNPDTFQIVEALHRDGDKMVAPVTRDRVT